MCINFKDKVSYLSFMARLVSAYLVYAMGQLIFLQVTQNSPTVLSQPNWPFVLGMTGGAFIILSLLTVIWPRLDEIYLLQVFLWLYLTMVIWWAPSATLLLGFSLLAMMLVTGLLYHRKHLVYAFVFTALVLGGRLFEIISRKDYEDVRPLVRAVRDLMKPHWLLVYGVILLLVLTLVAHRAWNSNSMSVKWERRLIKSLRIFIGLSAIAYLVYLSLAAVATLRMFHTTTYDMGLFTQMFDNMRESFQPMTTLERDGLLSHFAVHVSPIFYLLLPIYAVFPSPEALDIAQHLLVFSAIFPLYGILKCFRLPKILKTVILFWFLVTPAMTTSSLYHLHENAFLAPLVLWLIYAYLKEWRWGLVAISFLLLMVKEDAFIYVFSLGLFFLCQDRFAVAKSFRPYLWISQVIFPILYFGLCLMWLRHFGDGAMVYRYDGFLLPNQEGISHMVVNILTNPTYSLSVLFNQTKLEYLGFLLLSQAGLVLFQKYWRYYLLLLPLVVINLLTSFQYQFLWGFPYHYGSHLLVFFLSLLALENLWSLFKDSSDKVGRVFWKGTIVWLTWTGIVCSAAVLWNQTRHLPSKMMYYMTHREMLEQDHRVLANIAKDKKVLAYHSYTTALAHVDDLYDLHYHGSEDETIEMVIVDRDFDADSDVAEAVSAYQARGYKESSLSTPRILILEN